MFVLRVCLVSCLAWLAYASLKLDSVPAPTKLSLPKSQHPDGICYQGTQAQYGPTVGKDGKAVKYGPEENIRYGRNPETGVPGAAVWSQPSITLSNGSKCCDSLSQVREYIDYLDKTILDYLAFRQQLVVEARRFKDSKAAVRSPARAVQVVQNAMTVAEKNGLAPWVANATWTATLNSFTELELCLFDEDVRTKNYAPDPK